MIDIELLKYPIGKFVTPKEPLEKDLKEAADYLVAFPSFLQELAKDMSEEQLNTPYRPGGWTVKELIHHLADSHMNMIIRFKLALTEQNPTIVPYIESAWAKTMDYSLPISVPLAWFKESIKNLEPYWNQWIKPILIEHITIQSPKEIFHFGK